MPAQDDADVFVNCPFDRKYEPLFYALLFTIHDCGFRARSAREVDDSSDARISKLYRLIGECQYGIHDIPRTELDPTNRLPRFNMPLELGLFLGAKAYGDKANASKRCLILDRDPWRYQKFCSDIAGHDIRAHGNRVPRAIEQARDWLRQWLPSASRIPGGATIARRYRAFRGILPEACEVEGLDHRKLPYFDHHKLIVAWLQENPGPEAPNQA